MALTYREKMCITEKFLGDMRHRLGDKHASKLPTEGKYYFLTNPHDRCVVGNLGAMPDPDYTGPQSPNAVGMVLMVSPDDSGSIICSVGGQFDIVHRYIPDFLEMERELTRTDGIPNKSQVVPLALNRYTVSFEDVNLKFRVDEPNVWVSAKAELRSILQAHEDMVRQDRRVMRRCDSKSKLNHADLSFDFTPGMLDSQVTFDGSIYANCIVEPLKVLEYQVTLRGRIRRAPAGFGPSSAGKYLLELFLENQTRVEDSRPFGVEFPFLLDARMENRLLSGAWHKVPHRLQPEDYRFLDEDGLPGYGICCGVVNAGTDRFITDGMPTFAQPKVEAPSPSTVGMTTDPEYKLLAANPLPILNSFLVALEAYDQNWAERIEGLRHAGKLDEIDVAQRDRADFHREVERIRDGVKLLAGDAMLLHAFRLMNEAMACAIELQQKPFKTWHLFQLGFILTQIRSIYERHAPAAQIKGSMEIADVLWFATGGGKTEAYLGIISMQMLYSRMMGREYGVSAWMRFPLRMLSVQQFQRLSYVLAQSNIIRQREGLGGFPFTVGYYTGEGTPNRISSTYGEDRYRSFLPQLSERTLQGYQFISDCPYCGTRASIRVTRDYQKARIKHECSNNTCWSNTEAEQEPFGAGIRGDIGIFVSDEECTRYLPTVLVGTVDKLAIIGHNLRFMNFFGGAHYFCPEHGFTETSSCSHKRIVKVNDNWDTKKCGNNTRTTEVRVSPLPPMKDPGFSLLVQDELHLLRESLGNFDAHYETLLSALQVAHGGRHPKTLAATATIKDFKDHIKHLYLKDGVRFPAQGATLGESFYARRATEDGNPQIRRWFASILPVGRNRVGMRAVAEVSNRFLDQVDDWLGRLSNNDQSLMHEFGVDVSKIADVRYYIGKNLNTNLVYANSKRNTNEVRSYLDEIAARSGVDRQSQLLDGETPLDQILGAIHHIENKTAEDPLRHLVATSVVSHGVDISELNFMVMAGWPKSTAEYIQASARSGRVHPGIVMCVLSSSLMFETGVFLNFWDYHNFLDRLVDSVPINRFAPNVLDRTLPGIVTAVLLCWARSKPWGADIDLNVKSICKILQAAGGAGGAVGEEIKTIILASLRVPNAIAQELDDRVVADFNRRLVTQVEQCLRQLENWPGGRMDMRLGDAMAEIFGHKPFQSFRDIENQIVIKPASSDAGEILTALGR